MARKGEWVMTLLNRMMIIFLRVTVIPVEHDRFQRTEVEAAQIRELTKDAVISFIKVSHCKWIRGAPFWISQATFQRIVLFYFFGRGT